jgi:hypothetical protein
MRKMFYFEVQKMLALRLELELVTVFFCSSQPVPDFVRKCKQGYLIA